MKTSNYAIESIKQFEGCKLTAYRCPANVWTIGYGHTKNVTSGMKITQVEANNFIKSDILPIETFLKGSRLNLKQGQYDALIDFMFNLGITKFKNSTLFKLIKSKASDKDICNEFMKWVHAGSKVLHGLYKRRVWECEQWNKN